MQSEALVSQQPARVEALRARHARLSQKIEASQSSLSTDDSYLKDLKRQKLRLKEEIVGIRETS